MSSGDKKAIGAHLRAVREADPYWSRGDLARLFRAAVDELGLAPIPHVPSLTTMIKDWEAGKYLPGHRYRALYAHVTGKSQDELFDPEAGPPLPAWPTEEIELLDLASRAGVSDLPDGLLDLLDGVVDRLCRDYLTVAPDLLSSRSRAHLAYVLRLLDGRTTLAEHRELLVRAGWMSVLLACTLFDAGEKTSAEMIRQTARRLGEQAGHGEIVAWSWEIAAWFALVSGHFDKVVEYSEVGARHAGVTNAAVQLTLQAGRGYARMGDSRAHEALRIQGLIKFLERRGC